MLAKVTSCAVVGLDGALIQVEVDIANGLPATTTVGLPDAAVNESKERVRSAVRNSGFYFPGTRVTINLAPADLRKEGPAYDLPIALGVLISSEQIMADVEGAIVMGELSLDGSVRHVSSVLPMAALARDQGFNILYRLGPFQRDLSLDDISDAPPYAADMSEIKGQEHAKRALEVAAAGGLTCSCCSRQTAAFSVPLVLSRR